MANLSEFCAIMLTVATTWIVATSFAQRQQQTCRNRSKNQRSTRVNKQGGNRTSNRRSNLRAAQRSYNNNSQRRTSGTLGEW